MWAKKYKTVVIGNTTAPRNHDDFVLEGENTGFFSNDFRYDSDSDELVGLMGTPSSFHTPYATSPATGVINSTLAGNE